MSDQEIRDMQKVSNEHLKICEIFRTIQGEGANTGIPVIFIRLSLCNLHCSFCDTPFTWRWIGTNFKHDTKAWEKEAYDPREEIKMMTARQVCNETIRLAAPYIKNIVLTGGEPLMHQKSEAFKTLLEYLNHFGFKVEVETNGTIIPNWVSEEYISKFNVSPKTSNSNNSVAAREKSKAYQYYVGSERASFKFVIANEKDLIEVKDLIKRYKIPKEKVLIMPEGRTDKELNSISKELAEFCMDNGYRFCNRLQVQIWGSERGR